MEPDIILVAGLGLAVLSIPSILSAWAEGRAPRLGALLLVSGGGMILWAYRVREGGYSWAELPGVFYGVIGQVVN